MSYIYSVCVGKFHESSESSEVLKRLNKRGYKGFLFSMNDFYTLKVLTTINANQANYVFTMLKTLGFNVFIDQQEFKSQKK